MALTEEQRAKLEELKQEEREEAECWEQTAQFPTEEYYAAALEQERAEWEAKALHEQREEMIYREFCENSTRLDDIQRYYLEFEGLAVVEEKELAKRLRCTSQTIRNYTGRGIIEVLITDKAKCNPNGERRYFDLLKSTEAIEAYKAQYRQQRNETRKAGKQPDRDKKTHKFIKSK